MRRLVPHLALLALLAVACGGGGGKDDGGTAAPPCTPSGSTLTVTIKDLRFDKDCLAAPAGQPFTIKVDNKDGDQHNLAIYTSSAADKNLFRGDIKPGPAILTYKAPALKAGRYYFRCDVHPETNGTFIVQ